MAEISDFDSRYDHGTHPADRCDERPEDIHLLAEGDYGVEDQTEEVDTANPGDARAVASEAADQYSSFYQTHFLDRAGQVTEGLNQLEHSLENGSAGDDYDETMDSIDQLRREMAFLGRQLDLLISSAVESAATERVTEVLALDMFSRLDLAEGQFGELRHGLMASGRMASETQTNSAHPLAESSLWKILDKISIKFKDMFRDLWRLISSLLKPKEWTLKLKAVAFADMEIKFGR